jgi:hypothetical protein
MRKQYLLLWLWSSLLWSFGLEAQTTVNTKIEAFSAPELRKGGQRWALNQYNDKACVVLIFSNPECAYDKLYQDWFVDVSRQYSQVGWVFISTQQFAPDIYPPDVPLLYDEDGRLCQALKIEKTPECVLIQYQRGVWMVKYQGSLDERLNRARKENTPFLEQAIADVLAGRLIQTPFRRPIGCVVR